MMNNLDIPTNFKVIGFGTHISSVALEAIRGYGFDGVSIIDANEKSEIIPTDDDKMAIILTIGDESNAATCARTFYQAGVLTIAITCNGIQLSEDCCDTQTHVREIELIHTTVNLLNIIFNTSSYLCLDFNDLSGCLKDSRRFTTANLHGLGESRIEDALSHIKENLPKANLNKVENIIIEVYFDRDSKRPLEMNEVSGITNFISTLPEDVNAVYGLSHKNMAVSNSIDVVLILSGKELQI